MFRARHGHQAIKMPKGRRKSQLARAKGVHFRTMLSALVPFLVLAAIFLSVNLSSYDAPSQMLLSSSIGLNANQKGQMNQSYSKSKSSRFILSNVMPGCTSGQLKLIARNLHSPERLQRFSNCPETSSWLFSSDRTWLTRLKQPHDPLIAIYAGCNKGMDAVNTLRALSQNASIDKQIWKDSLRPGKSACGQTNSPQHEILSNSTMRLAHVYCIEAMPSTARVLKRAVESLGWTSQFHIVHAAVDATDGTLRFPDAGAGVEHLGVWACLEPQYRSSCRRVRKISLDTFVLKQQQHFNERTLVDYLSIDVEGNDWHVLLGASQILDQTKYLEFEYHNVGAWVSHNLSTAIDFLAAKGFACFWSGRQGKLIQITGCFRSEYNEYKTWSNVACAHHTRAPDLLWQMRKIHEDFLLRQQEKRAQRKRGKQK